MNLHDMTVTRFQITVENKIQRFTQFKNIKNII